MKSLASSVQDIILSESGARAWVFIDAPRRGWLAVRRLRCLAHASRSLILRSCGGASSFKISWLSPTFNGSKATLPVPRKQAGEVSKVCQEGSIRANYPFPPVLSCVPAQTTHLRLTHFISESFWKSFVFALRSHNYRFAIRWAPRGCGWLSGSWNFPDTWCPVVLTTWRTSGAGGGVTRLC